MWCVFLLFGVAASSVLPSSCCLWTASEPPTWRRASLSSPTYINSVRPLYFSYILLPKFSCEGPGLCCDTWSWSLCLKCTFDGEMFPLRNVWYVRSLHATGLPNKDLPELIHTRHSKWPITCYRCLYVSHRCRGNKRRDVALSPCRVCTQSPMGLWVTPCTTRCSTPPSACEPERSWTIAGGADSLWVHWSVTSWHGKLIFPKCSYLTAFSVALWVM